MAYFPLLSPPIEGLSGGDAGVRWRPTSLRRAAAPAHLSVQRRLTSPEIQHPGNRTCRCRWQRLATGCRHPLVRSSRSPSTARSSASEWSPPSARTPSVGAIKDW